jgi:DNA-binding response OmpR family regulator
VRTVLIVDDERWVRQLYRDAFEDAGYRVLEAEDGDVALQVLRTTRPDLAILDIHMPHTHGLELLTNIHRAWPKLPIILCSALPKLFDEYAVWDAGTQVVGLFPKPVELSALLGCVARALSEESGVPVAAGTY